MVVTCACTLTYVHNWTILLYAMLPIVNIVNVLVYIRMIEINTITITYQNYLSIVFLM